MTSLEGDLEHEIRTRAYALWEKAGRPDGEATHFWETASAQVLREAASRLTFPEKIADYDYHHIRQFRGVRDTHFGHLVYELQRRVPELQNEPPGQTELWHYTSANSLVAILDSGTMWATHIGCMNDGVEFTYALSLMQEVLSLSNRKRYRSDADHAFHDFLAERLKMRSVSYQRIYTLSFSEVRDDLSQWRAYGGSQGENGFLIGFDSDALTKYATGPNRSLAKIIYDEGVQRYVCRLLLEITFASFRSGLDSIGQRPTNYVEVWSEVVYRYLENYAYGIFTRMKNPAFHSEREWRLMLRVFNQDDIARLRYLARPAMVSRHLPIHLSEAPQSDRRLPIREIVVGPSRHQSVSADSVWHMLHTRGYFEPDPPWTPSVTRSDIPLQSP